MLKRRLWKSVRLLIDIYQRMQLHARGRMVKTAYSHLPSPSLAIALALLAPEYCIRLMGKMAILTFTFFCPIARYF
jgi:hypothetical protein